jgi:hypothetical protein
MAFVNLFAGRFESKIQVKGVLTLKRALYFQPAQARLSPSLAPCGPLAKASQGSRAGSRPARP